MTDRHKGYVVYLDKDIREDDAEHVINALMMVRGVIKVEPIINSEILGQSVAVARATRAHVTDLLNLMRKWDGKPPLPEDGT